MIKSQILTTVISLFSLCSINLLFIPTVKADVRKFYCGKDNKGIPNTFARTHKDDIAIIKWEKWLNK